MLSLKVTKTESLPVVKKLLNEEPDWSLITIIMMFPVLRSVRERDGGSYECQVSMRKKLSLTVQLRVLVPRLVLEGPSQVFTQSGSVVNLQCRLVNINRQSRIVW